MAPLSRLTSDVRSNLVAYLDGELDEETMERIDQTVASNEVARREIERLSRVYDLLDELPQERPSPDFTNTAISAIQDEVADEGSIGLLQDRVNRFKPLAIAAAFAFAVTMAGTLLGAAAFREAEIRRLKALPAAEQFATLRAVGDSEFLRRLASEQRLVERIQRAGDETARDSDANASPMPNRGGGS